MTTNEVQGRTILSEEKLNNLSEWMAHTANGYLPRQRGDEVLAMLAEIRALRAELATPEDERAEHRWSRGYRIALTGVISAALGNLGYRDSDATRANWVIEREWAIRALRSVCEIWGDNDWGPDLNLADVISKHLERHLHANRDESDDSDRNDAWWCRLSADERSRLMDQCHSKGELL
jgi:hypothetical protein